MQILQRFLKTPIALSAIFGSLLISAPIAAETPNPITEQQLALLGTTQRVIPPPEIRSDAIAQLIAIEGKVDIVLINRTNADVIYEVIGHTNSRILSGGSKTRLEDLPVPVSLTTIRQDNGFVRVIPQKTNDETLVLVLEEAVFPLDNPQGAIYIQADGEFLLF